MVSVDWERGTVLYRLARPLNIKTIILVMSSNLEDWRIDATVHKDRVEEVHQPSNSASERQIHTWKVEKFLGRGGFGEVRLERNEGNGQVRAVKKIAAASAALSDSECAEELKALLEFSTPKFQDAAVFVEFFGWFKDGIDLFLAMQYYPLGDLDKNLDKSRRVPEAEAQLIAQQILKGLDIMHAASFAHRDLKPQNVLVVRGSPRWLIRLADFGFSKRLTDTTGLYTIGGTTLYMAPELRDLIELRGEEYGYTNAVDIWSTGCIVYSLLTGSVPFPSGSPALMKYCSNSTTFPSEALLGNGASSMAVEFLKNLLVPQPSGRLPAAEAVKHPWIVSDLASSSTASSSPSSGDLANAPEPDSAISSMNINTASHGGLQSIRSFITSFGRAMRLYPSPKPDAPAGETTIRASNPEGFLITREDIAAAITTPPVDETEEDAEEETVMDEKAAYRSSSESERPAV